MIWRGNGLSLCATLKSCQPDRLDKREHADKATHPPAPDPGQFGITEKLASLRSGDFLPRLRFGVVARFDFTRRVRGGG